MVSAGAVRLLPLVTPLESEQNIILCDLSGVW